MCQMSTGVLGPPSATVHLELQHNLQKRRWLMRSERTLVRTRMRPRIWPLPKIETALALIVESQLPMRSMSEKLSEKCLE